eukprot:364496-Chlamydomonas_euryale.AAC.29
MVITMPGHVPAAGAACWHCWGLPLGQHCRSCPTCPESPQQVCQPRLRRSSLAIHIPARPILWIKMSIGGSFHLTHTLHIPKGACAHEELAHIRLCYSPPNWHPVHPRSSCVPGFEALSSLTSTLADRRFIETKETNIDCRL